MNKLMYRPEIDGLRCFAVLSVVMFHFDFFLNLPLNPFKGGYIGVDVFFVISGYVITQSITKSLTNGRFSFLGFYRARIKRLFPAIITTLILCFLFGYFFLYGEEFKYLAENAIYSMFFIQNIHLSEGAGYFSGEAEVNLLLHFWSLSVEEQFYLFFPFFLIFINRFFSKKNHSTIIFSLILLGYTYSNWIANFNANDNFYLLQSRFFQLLLGAFVFYLREQYSHSISNSRISDILSIFGLFLISHYVVFGGVKSVGPSFESMAPMVGIAIVLLMLTKDSFVGRFLCLKPLSLLGLISYEVYLLHFPLISGLTIFFGGFDNISIQVKSLSLLLCLVLSFFVHFYITNKVRYDEHRFRGWVGSLITYLLVAFLFVFVFKSEGMLKGSFSKKNEEIGIQIEGPLWQYHNNEICLDKYAPENYKDYGWFFCYLSEDKDPEILILGTSFSNHWYPMVSNADLFSSKTVLSYGNNAIQSYFDDSLKVTDNKKSRVTYSTGEVVKKRLLTNENLEYVIITQSGMPNGNNIEALKEIRKLGDFKMVLILPHAKPEWKEVDTAACFARPFSDVPDKCSMNISDTNQAFSDENKASLKALTSQLDDFYVFDPNVSYCHEGECDFTEGGKPVFRDVYHHVSVHGNELTQPFFDKFLEQEVGLKSQ
jgi:peptidoglycan/LPS O-acetylase OafA/YrhL